MADRNRPNRVQHKEPLALPWWQALVLAVALAILGVAIGRNLGGDSAPGAGSVDVGFLQDMRFHHDQAVQMSMLLLDKPKDSIDPTLHLMASTIAFGQQLENGMFVQILRDWGRSEQNETDKAMKWMGHEVPLAEMEGLASSDDMTKLSNATGLDASKLFANLMIAHHLGGQHMAEYAASHASTAKVQDIARPMVHNQRQEIVELQQALTKLG